MDVDDAVKRRLEVRDFADESVPEAVIQDVLDGGRLAPSGRNTQHWRFILLEAQRDLNELAELSPTGGWVNDAAFAIVVCTDPTHDYHEIDAGRAITHMQLIAWAHGVGSCIFTVDNPELDAYLEVPEEYELTLVGAFGYPAREIQGKKDRKPLSTVAFEDRFGRPLE